MPTDWRAWCTGDRLALEGDDVLVTFENGRKHRVRVRETEDAYELHTIVARAGAVRDVEELAINIWRRNRAAQLVGFSLDRRGGVRGTGWVPKAGATKDEFAITLRRVAAESDRFEFLLTGRDVE
jgi:hypothetical protein